MISGLQTLQLNAVFLNFNNNYNWCILILIMIYVSVIGWMVIILLERIFIFFNIIKNIFLKI
jgi:hypothetical protein